MVPMDPFMKVECGTANWDAVPVISRSLGQITELAE